MTDFAISYGKNRSNFFFESCKFFDFVGFAEVIFGEGSSSQVLYFCDVETGLTDHVQLPDQVTV